MKYIFVVIERIIHKLENAFKHRYNGVIKTF